jgi:hypothetical protein
MNRIDQRLEFLAARARQCSLTDEMQPRDVFASQVLSRVAIGQNCSRPIALQWRRSATPALAEKVNNIDNTSLWMRFSLASLPLGAIVMIVCLLWFGLEVPHDVGDLASSFVQSQLLP